MSVKTLFRVKVQVPQKGAITLSEGSKLTIRELSSMDELQFSFHDKFEKKLAFVSPQHSLLIFTVRLPILF